MVAGFCGRIIVFVTFLDVVDSITPSHFVKLRSLLNSSAMDILYYTSPLYRAEVSGVCY